MAKEVLLMADVKDLGAEGDVVNVSDGYARNYLFPKNLAAQVTDVTRKRLEKIRSEREAALKVELEEAQKAAGGFQNVSCTIPVKTGQDEKLYGSVTVQNILEALVDQGIKNIDKYEILLDEPIKELGVYDIKVKLHPEVEVTIKVWVVEE